ncbi:MAG: NAD(P)H-hydrate epimerase, partial [Sulfuricurvum sp.]|uniref:NAD(P)H-hydrate epimerase n=1 Tax=Sulfuricurvum sp. TaxID=2025608 RepID=UPI0027355823
MQNLYLDVSHLDQRSVTKFALSEEVMMEHAAMAMAHLIRSRFALDSSVLIVCGSGNNGADGLALARLLRGEYHVSIHIPFGASSPLAHLQRERVETLGLKHSSLEGKYDVIVDALFGSGLNRPLGPTAIEVLVSMNRMSGFKIACDVPSGLYADGTFDEPIFHADITLTMGSLKRGLFSDAAK